MVIPFNYMKIIHFFFTKVYTWNDKLVDNEQSSSSSKKLMEINGYPNRLDLRDDLVRLALKFGVKFVIDTDAHEVDQMDNMRFGVSVARRGWVESKDVVNSWEWKKFAEWFNIH